MKKTVFKIVCVLMFCTLPRVLFAQVVSYKYYIDSVYKRLSKARPDTNAVHDHFTVAKSMIDGGFFTDYGGRNRTVNYTKAQMDTIERGLPYIEKGLVLAKKLKWNKGIALAYASRAYYYAYLNNEVAMVEWNKKTLAVPNSKVVKNDLASYDITNNYTSLYNANNIGGPFDKALPIYFKGIKFLHALNYKKAEAVLLELVSSVYGDNKYPQKELEYLLAALKLYDEKDISYERINVLVSIARLYRKLHDLPRSLAMFQKAQKLVDTAPKTDGFVNSNKENIYSGIAQLYVDLHDYKKALEYHEKVRAITKMQNQGKMHFGEGTDYRNIARDKRLLGDLEGALKAINESIVLMAVWQKEDPSTISGSILASSYRERAAIYVELKRYEEALADAQAAQKMKRTGGQLPELILGAIYLNASDAVLTKAGIKPADKYASALEVFNANLKNTPIYDADLLTIYRGLALVYEKMGDVKNGLTAYKKYIAARDSLNVLSDNNGVARQEEQYQSVKREDSIRFKQLIASNQLKAQLQLINKDKELQAAKYQQSQASLNANKQALKASQNASALADKTLQLQKVDLNNKQAQGYYLMGGIGLMLLLSLFIGRSYYQQRKSNKAITEANLLLNERQEEIAAQRDQLSEAFNELTQTQQQLIHAEKMASLGELTSGIAHEIQNPLNFVNNFSDVNREMLDELEIELKAGNLEDALAIAADIKQNEAKIHHHGKRADSIVKGMLQHSRSNTGQKEPTDINKLADETLGLAYHAFQTNHPEFHATIKTNFDDTLPLINILLQDIGRVLLNLLNNALYAVHKKAQTAGADYEPMVVVETIKTPGYTEIKVRDNGNGIPDAIKDKIMQPFFTTKPTGEGTGLGLSLSYDIVTKAHNGKLIVNSREGQGAEFIVSLQVS